MSSHDIAIKVEHVTKTFKLPHERNSSVKSALINFKKRGYEKQVALKDISFEIKQGEFFGIVGRNGSGKSTLLKLLSGIYAPDEGIIHVQGTLTPFIELGVGFNPELTGRENVFLNGALLGFNRKEMAAMYNVIVEFAELERFMDQKLKNYSSGMQVRLAFAIAIQAKSEILLLDEVLAVGDQNFQRKCFNYFSQLKKEGRTVVLVSHDMNAVRQYCDRALLLNEGEVRLIGDVDKVSEIYNSLNIEKQLSDSKKNRNQTADTSQKRAKILTIRPVDKNGADKDTFLPGEDINIEFVAKAEANLHSPTLGIVISDENKLTSFATNTPAMDVKLKDLKKGETVKGTFTIDNIYTDGLYWLSGAISNSADSIPREAYDRVEKITPFTVSGRQLKASLTHPHHDIQLKYEK